MDNDSEANRPNPRSRGAGLKKWLLALPVMAGLALVAAIIFGTSPQLLADNGPLDTPSSSAPAPSPTVLSSPPNPPSPSDSVGKSTAKAIASQSSSPTADASSAHSADSDAASDVSSGADVDIAAAGPQWLTIGSAGIDMSVLPLTPTQSDLASQSIVPPFTLDAYWLTSYGKPGAGSENTTYIAGHSWEDRDAPFNRLSTHAKIGDAISLSTANGTLDYVIDSVTTHDKDTLKNSDIWDIVPNRLVLISCYTADPYGKNVIVTAMPAS